MDYMEVGWIRELGKRAVLMMVTIAQMAALREAVEGELEVGDRSDEDDQDEDEDAFETDLYVDEDGEEAGLGMGSPNPDRQDQPDLEPPPETGDDEGEIDMDLDMEDGEISDDGANEEDANTALAAAKARLLAQVDDAETQESQAGPANEEEAASYDDEDAFDEMRSRINLRATLNMILTVAGEFYGQRDLLEFRDPFTGLDSTEQV
jgi:hypothetical protein